MHCGMGSCLCDRKSPKGAHFLAAVDMGLAEKDNRKMAQYLHEKCVETGYEKSFYLCVLDGALRDVNRFSNLRCCF
jgi:hypothetical protein